MSKIEERIIQWLKILIGIGTVVYFAIKVEEVIALLDAGTR